VHRLVPRHRRKAGSGPPATALIAWIGTDTYLREAAATASYRRWMAWPMPSNTRSAGAAVVACFTLACTAVLGITAIISHGRATAQHKIAIPSVSGRDGAPTPSPESSLTLPAGGSGVSPTPADIAPMLAERGSPQPVTVPPAAKNIDQRTSEHLSSPQENVRLNPTPTPVPTTSSRHFDKPSHSGEPVDQVDTVAVGKPRGSSKSGDTDTHTLLAGNKPDDSGAPTNPSTPHSEQSADPADSGNQGASNDPTYQREPVALTVPGTHRSRNETSRPAPTGQIDGDDSRPTPGEPASAGDSTQGDSSIAGQGSAPLQKSTSSRTSRSRGG
jgi:hypothetical protein